MTIRKALLLGAPILLLPCALFSADEPAGKGTGSVEANVVWRSPAPVSVKELANMPRLVGSPAMPYPEVARQSRVGGPVCLDITINPKGRVSKVDVVCGHEMLRVFAKHMVQQWRYTPALADGRPVEAKGYIVLHYALD